MKKILILLLVLIVSCQNKEKATQIPSAAATDVSWLIGNWKRTNEKPDRETYENWIKINDNTFAGDSFTIKDKDTIWQEKVSLSQSNGNWNFAVTAKGESKSTVFKFTQSDNDSFTCENQQNEFPTIIRYFKDNGKLKAEIEGGEMKIAYEFERISK